MTAEVGTLRVSMALDDAQFTQRIKDINTKLSGIQSEFKAASVGVDKFGSSLEHLQNSAAIIGNKLEMQKQKVEELKRRYDTLASSQDANVRDLDRAAGAYNNALAAMKKTELQLGQINNQIKQQSGVWNNLRNNLKDVGQRMQEVGGQMQDVGSEIATTFGAATAALGAGLGIAVKSAADFEAQLSNIKAVSGATSDEMQTLQQIAVKYGAATKYSSLEAAQGIEELIKAGVSIKDIINGGLEGALSLATAGELELADAAEIASTALNAFKADNLTVVQAANLLAGGANASATSVGELKFGLSQVSAVAAGVGLSFKDTTTALSLFANNGLKGSDAGTSLKTMLSNLIPKSDKAIVTMERLGIVTKKGANAFFDAHGNIKSLAAISNILQKALKNLNAEQRQEALYMMFGSDAIRAANVLYKEGAVGVNKMYTEMSKVTSAQVATEKMNNFKGKIEELKGAVETAGISIGNALLPAVTKIVQVLQYLTNAFNNLSPTTQKFIAIGGALATVLLGIITSFGVILAVVGSAVTGFGALATALAGAGGAAAIFSGAIAVITGPVGIAVAAIAGLIAVFTALYKNNETFRNGVNQIWQEISNKFNQYLTFIGSIVRSVMTSVQAFFQEVLTKIKGFWQENGSTIMAIVKLFMDNIRSTIQMVMGIIKGIFQVVWPIISAVVRTAWEGIKLIVKTGLDIILGAIQFTLKVLTGDWKGAFNTIKQTATNIFNNIVTFFKNIDLLQTGKNIIQGLINGMSTMVGAVVDKVKSIANSVSSTIKNVLDIHSPSKVTHKLGEHTGQGFANGIANKKKEIERKAKEAAEAAKKKFESALGLADYKFKMGSIDSNQYLAELKKLVKTKGLTVDQIRSLNLQIKDLEEDRAEKVAAVREKIEETNNEYIDKIQQANERLIENEKRLNEEYNKAVQERANSLYSFAGIFDEIKGKEEPVTGVKLLDNLKSQVTAFQDWSDNIKKLSTKGIDEGLIKELEEMGPKAYAEIGALNQLSDEQLSEYVRLWQEKHSLAKTTAVQELEDMRVETQKQIAQLRLETAQQLVTYQQEWYNKISAIKLDAKGIFETLAIETPSIGVNAIQGLIDGMDSMMKPLMDKAQAIADAVTNTLKKALKIKSPSQVMRDEVGKWIPEGLAMGITKNLNVVVSASEKMANAAIPTMPAQSTVTTSETVNHYTIQATINARDLQEVKTVTDFINSLNQKSRALGVR